jgi:hypothetical protein
MPPERSVTLFMLVTDRDCVFADYAVRSYGKLAGADADFVLFVYLNCLSKENVERYAGRWRSYPYVEVFDNTEKVRATPLYPGQEMTSPEGVLRRRDDAAENYDELWTSELKTFRTPFVATVDADFEVLHPDFYHHLVAALRADPSAIGASTDYSPTARVYDTYSERHVVLWERNHTWFCLYRREAFELSAASHFYYEEPDADWGTIAFDSAAYFQHDLRYAHGRTFVSLPPEFSGSFLHYGAASKNRSITRRNVWFYRRVFIWSTVGLVYGSRLGPAGRALNAVVRKAARRAFRSLLDRTAAERSTDVYEEQP